MRNGKRDLSKENSEGNISKKGFGISKEKTSITQQFYNPHEKKRLLKNKSNTGKSIEKMKYSAIKTQRNKINEKFQKTNGIEMVPHSKNKYKNEINYSINNTFESINGISSKSGDKQAYNETRKPENYKNKDISHLEQREDGENGGLTVDSARSSDNSNNYIKNPVKEFMEAASGGVRDKLDKYLKSGKIPDIN